MYDLKKFQRIFKFRSVAASKSFKVKISFTILTHLTLDQVLIKINCFLLKDKSNLVSKKHHSDFTFWRTLMKKLKKQQKQEEINALRPLEQEQR